MHLDRLLLGAAVFMGCSCVTQRRATSAEAPAPEDPIAVARTVVDAYIAGYYEQFPEDAYEYGYPSAPWDRFSDRSPAAMQAWHEQEERWLEQARRVAAATAGTDLAIPLAYTIERLEASIAERVCRTHLWHVSPTWTGWQSIFAEALRVQPMGTPARREAFLARLRDIPRYLATERDNLRRGLAEGYSAPRSNVDAVVGQLDGLVDASAADSAFLRPARDDGDPALLRTAARVWSDEVVPAIATFRDFLRDEYAPAARTEPGVAANPDGRACYAASIRRYVGLDVPAQEIHELGLQEMERISEAMREISKRSFGTEDVGRLLQELRTDPRYTFATRDELIDYARAAVDAAQRASPQWFSFMPRTPVEVVPYPPGKDQGQPAGLYTSGAADLSTPGTYQVNASDPRGTSRAGVQAIAFHETYPGHHLQAYAVRERGGAHPIVVYFHSGGSSEGWALYSERLADEMGLYSADIDRLGMLSAQANRAARLVVDPGLHVLGWSRDAAVEYIVNHTTHSRAAAEEDVARYLAVPGQATSYMLGALEIQRLRELARHELGDRFDLREFHDRILRAGAIPLGLLRVEIERWIAGG